ncbi:MAG: histidine kinase [Coriobacteriales bacterium]|jgi:signal transduction histidine kinase|nr:histidine kinase [Coriobacteriales bacterium]
MRERSWFFFVLELCMGAFCLFFGFGSGVDFGAGFGSATGSEAGAAAGPGAAAASGSTFGAHADLMFGLGEQGAGALVAAVLVLSCVLTAKLLAGLLKAPRWAFLVCAGAAAAIAFALCPNTFLALAAVLALDAGSRWRDDHLAFALVLAGAVLLALAFPQTPGALLTTAAGLALAFAGTALVRLLARAQGELAVFAERAATLEARLEEQRATIGTIEQQGRVAERNRLAARIHDRVGHGMTGSILMLEAAQLQLENDAPAARASIETATENLRESVEDIRRELREERASGGSVGPAQIAAELEAFSAEHPAVRTEFVTEGSLERVPQAVWLCVFESLGETLTNLLRHSDANHFRVSISQRNRLFVAEFGDNGRAALGGSSGGSSGTAATHSGSGAGVAARGVRGARAASRGARSARTASRGASGGGIAPAALRSDGSVDTRVLVGRGIGLAAIEERALLSGGRAFFSLTPQGFTTRLVFTLRG